MRAGAFLSSVSALLLLPGLTAASTISYMTQDRSVVAAVPDDAPGVAIAADFAIFNANVDAMGLESGDFTGARQHSVLGGDAISADLFASAGSGGFDRGQGVARSVFDITFSLTEEHAFDVTGQLTTGTSLFATGDTATFMLETSGGDEIELDWVEQGGTAGINQTLDSVVYLAAGTYRLRLEAGAEMDCLADCGFWDDQRSGTAIFTMTAVPVPPALLLFPSALVALGWLRRRN